MARCQALLPHFFIVENAIDVFVFIVSHVDVVWEVNQVEMDFILEAKLLYEDVTVSTKLSYEDVMEEAAREYQVDFVALVEVAGAAVVVVLVEFVTTSGAILGAGLAILVASTSLLGCADPMKFARS